MNLATQADVEAQLGRELTEAELLRLPGLLAKASVIVEGYLNRVYTDPDDVPSAVTIVVAGMVARVLGAGTPQPDMVAAAGVTSEDMGYGPIRWQRSFADGAAPAEPWLSAGDRTALRPYRIQVVSVALGSERY